MRSQITNPSNVFLLIRNTLNIIIGSILWILILIPAGSTILVPLVLFRYFIQFLAKHFQPELIPLTSPLDNIWAFQPFPFMSPTQVWKIQGKLEVKELRKHFYNVFMSTEELRVKYRNLFCYLKMWMFYCFKRPLETIVLENMITELCLSKVELQKDFGGLDSFIGKWMRQIDYDKVPHWSILVLNILKDDGIKGEDEETETILLFKIDHTLCDGYTFIHLVEKLSGIKSPYLVKDEEISWSKKIQYTLTLPIVGLFYGFSLFCTKNLPLLERETFSLKKGFKKNNLCCTNSSQTESEMEWLYSSTTLNLSDVKKVRQKTQTRFLTVLATLETGALRRYLLENGVKISNLPNQIYIPSASSLAGHPAMVEGGMKNHLAQTIFKMPFRKDQDSIQRLKLGEEDHLYCQEIGWTKMILYFGIPITWAIPNNLMGFVYRYFLKVKPMGIYHILSPLVLSNEPYSILGLKVTNIFLPLYTPNDYKPLKYLLVPVSNQDKIDLSVNATSDLFPTQTDLDRFTRVYLKEELDQMVSDCNDC